MSSSTPDSLRFHADHIWVKPTENENEVIVGISDFAQKQLGTIVFVELPRTGDRLNIGKPFGAVESYKVVSDLIAPISGEIVDVNAELAHKAALLNEDCYGTGWLARVRACRPEDFGALKTLAAYLELLGERAK